MGKIKNIIILLLIIFILFLLNKDNPDNNSVNNQNGHSKTSYIKNNKKHIKKDIDEKKEYKVVRVVDGDTIIVDIDNFKQRIRIIGINTPESHEINGRVVECFGKEAEKKAKEILNNKKVFIETDGSQDRYDKHGRLLAHIFYINNEGKKINFAKKMIEDGYGYEFTYRLPYKYQKEYKKAQKEAQKYKNGLWNKKTCNGKKK